MASFDTTRPTYDSAPVAARFFGIFGRAFGSMIEWNDARVTRNALSALTDRELEDIGLYRSDIDRIAGFTLIH
ncbi:hypothetical protein C1J03_06365 [Sulfitobacter sp. SK012]|jgi:uncharacterized protein YjiS (DUF1127 family)|uniref:DUF1127 domain-containing protein n=1 Tax=Sulfitobacter sp. SK012 TaxID=1389005 RepID=UPI000E0AE78F|nr:DUF1127 domain-containing protein [Sulfitobacter sp. SK012]AXI45689.1 hypothetical protein C1J03_06365 [Sulfitobacter sp. SK012]